MTIFIASDLHINHSNILKYCPNRMSGRPLPESGTEEYKSEIHRMNELIISNWNSVVDPDDEVYILGDVAMGQIHLSPVLIRRLNGKKYLIAGNHDKTLRKLIDNNPEELGDLFVWIKDVHEMFWKVGDLKVPIFMSHYPVSHWNMMVSDYNKTSIHFHGHLHCSNGKHAHDGAIMDVGIDGNDLFPYSLEEAVKLALNHAKDYPSKGHHS